MVLFAAAILILAGSFAARHLRVSASARRRLLLVGGATIIAALVLSALRLTPFALLALLVGAGFAANSVIRELGGREGFEGAEGEDPPRRAEPRGMGQEEALAILGLSGSPDPAAIRSAHRRMIVRAHPDQGGSDYLAAKVNEARQVLLPED